MIYCRKGGNPFTKENLALFYHAIINVYYRKKKYLPPNLGIGKG